MRLIFVLQFDHMFIVLLLFINLFHAFHLSTTEVNYDEQTNALQIATKVFIDDLEAELALYGHKKLAIGTGTEAPQVDSLLAIYFSEQLQFKVNGTVQAQQYLGKELSDDLIAIWSYIEIPLQEVPEELQVNNSILTQLFDDQKNIVIVKENNKMMEHEFLDKDTKSLSVNF